MSYPSLDTLATLLETAGNAHGAYETTELGGVYDQQWPQWYAAYLVAHGINDLLPAPLISEQLSQELAQIDREHRQLTPSQPWTHYYAARLLGRSE